MKASTALLSLAGIIPQVYAHPAHAGAGTNRGVVRRTVDLDAFRLPLTGDYIDAATVQADPPMNSFQPVSYVEAATQLVKQIAPDAEFRLVRDHYVGDNGVGHVNFKQTAHGLDIDNADFNVNVSCLSRTTWTPN
jgi:extracellular elastinolytic metalloproteinase